MVVALLALLVFAGSQTIIAQGSQKRNVSAFTQISIKIDAEVHLKQGNTQSVEISGDESSLNRLITDVSGRTLVIKYPVDTWFSKWQPGKVDVYITIPQIDELIVSGSGSILSEDKINTRILNLFISGSGNIKLANLLAEKVIVTLSGSGNVTLAGNGTASEFKSIISGSGNVKAIDFQANDVDVKISGSGDCYVNALKNLIAKLAGTGDVIYRGNPMIESTILGTSTVRKE